MTARSLGSTTCPFQMNPIDFVCLGLLIEFQSIKLHLVDQKTDDQENRLAPSTEDTKKSYVLMESLLHITSDLIFGEDDGEKRVQSIADIYHILRSKIRGIDQNRLHHHITSINHILNFAFHGSIDGLYEFENRLYTLIAPPATDANPDRTLEFHLDSPLGIYIRRCRLYISTLEFDRVSDLASRLKTFCTIDHLGTTNQRPMMVGVKTPSPGSHPWPLDANFLASSHSVDQKPIDPVTQTYLDFTDSYAPDFTKASISLRRFYDIRSSTNDRLHLSGSSHQQALFSLAQFYYSAEAYPAAIDALEEATRLARLAGDRSILDQCTCLRRRMLYFSGLETDQTGTPAAQQPLAGPIQAQAGLQSLRNLDEPARKSKGKANFGAGLADEWLYWDSNEEIFSVFKGLSQAEPINQLYAKLFRASRMSISNSDATESNKKVVNNDQLDRVAWFGLQAKIWDLQGQPGLCEIYEDLALQVDEEGGLDDRPKLITKSDVICHKALRFACKGNFNEALLILVEEARLNRSWYRSFRFIHQTIFDVLEMKAKHEKDEDALVSVQTLRMRLPSYESGSICVRKHIEDLYTQASSLMKTGNAHMALCPIVSGITHADKMNLKVDQVRGVTLWAEAMLLCQPDDASGWVRSKMAEQRVFDVPGFQSNWKLAADALLVQARCEIMELFGGDGTQLEKAGSLSLQVDRIMELLDMLTTVEKLCEKSEDASRRDIVFGYQVAVLKESLARGVQDDQHINRAELHRMLKRWKEDEGGRKALAVARNGALKGLVGSVQSTLACLSANRYLGR